MRQESSGGFRAYAGMKSVFVNFFVYAIGNFLAVGVMSVFYVAPLGRRCWGLFRVGSMGYKRFVGPGPSLHTASLRHPRARSLKPADWRVACCDL
eukprot:s1758_g17.t1